MLQGHYGTVADMSPQVGPTVEAAPRVQERQHTPKRSGEMRSSLQIQLLGDRGDPFSEAEETSDLVATDLLLEPIPQ